MILLLEIMWYVTIPSILLCIIGIIYRPFRMVH